MENLSNEEVGVLHKSQWLLYAKQLRDYSIGDVPLPDYGVWRRGNTGIGCYACLYTRQFNDDCSHCPIDWYGGENGNTGKLWCLEKESINRGFYDRFFEFKNSVLGYLKGESNVTRQEVMKMAKELSVLAEKIAKLPLRKYV